MLRILPIAMITMIGFLAFKAVEYKQDMQTQAEVEKVIAALIPSAGEAVEEDESVQDANGDPVAENLGSGHARDGAQVEGVASLGPNESGLPDYVSFKAPDENFSRYSDSEKELLERLQQRRLELVGWENELSLKAGLIEASSKKLDSKISQLEFLKKQTEELIAVYEEHDDTKIRSLVKIYETMKPKDAAAVFEQMNMDVMLLLVDKMSERRAAPILAKMNPVRAKQITEKLANQRNLAQEQGIASAR